jgi:hypothetical protein
MGKLVSGGAVSLFIGIMLLGSVNMVEARSGCCSHHGGVCGCKCCDGASLSDTCAPYYPACNQAKPDVPAAIPRGEVKNIAPVKVEAENVVPVAASQGIANKVTEQPVVKVEQPASADINSGGTASNDVGVGKKEETGTVAGAEAVKNDASENAVKAEEDKPSAAVLIASPSQGGGGDNPAKGGSSGLGGIIGIGILGLIYYKFKKN